MIALGHIDIPCPIVNRCLRIRAHEQLFITPPLSLRAFRVAFSITGILLGGNGAAARAWAFEGVSVFPRTLLARNYLRNGNQ